MQNFTNKPSLLKYEHFSFLIMDAPQDNNIHMYIKEMKKNNVVALVRACEPTYDVEPVKTMGIEIHELEFPDGEPPNSDIIDAWLALVERTFEHSSKPDKSIAVHCVAGLGRAPVLVAIALIENGVDPINAVEIIRKCRRGSINLRQLKYLEKYTPKRGHKHKCCIM